jgi:hypothetical protein
MPNLARATVEALIGSAVLTLGIMLSSSVRAEYPDHPIKTCCALRARGLIRYRRPSSCRISS